MGNVLILLLKTLVLTLGQSFGEKLAAEVVKTAAKKCPDKVDEICEAAKAKTKKDPP